MLLCSIWIVCSLFIGSFFFANLKLSQVISKLTDGKASHIPYRDSKLTRLLQSSLSGHGRVSVSLKPKFQFIKKTLSHGYLLKIESYSYWTIIPFARGGKTGEMGNESKGTFCSKYSTLETVSV